ncbi:MAG: LrgB family protein [Carnobacterium sp.]|uniref:LrgB family protein n=1 Tax=Carnobacterium antarcticum TaxID=2126436 RepID=A0ABW4NK39_9LACT|nr:MULTISPECIES: LrgB family protein [unclassified Carnobacterium]ALV21915.1 LrgA-associated membrane protein LrgB [Carnobacterium sp. CP1]QQP69891.1 LrgB family protein [Carnobacterium sp. CS13]
MFDKILTSPFLWIVVTVGLYLLAGKLKAKWPNPLFTPLVFAIVVIIILLLVTDIPLETYNTGGQFFSLFVTPATVALAIKLEKNFVYLKKYYPAILTGIVSGVVFHTVMIFAFALLFQFDRNMVATLIPKSITTAIAVGVSESLGGIVSLTVAVVVFTGVIGAVVGQTVFKIFKIDDPVAQGVALGSSSHAMGTTKAIEMGDVQGAMSGLSIVVTGIVVVILAPLTVPIINLLF